MDYFPRILLLKMIYCTILILSAINTWKNGISRTGGIYFWANSNGMAKFLETGDHQYLSENAKPHKQGLDETVARLMQIK